MDSRFRLCCGRCVAEYDLSLKNEGDAVVNYDYTNHKYGVDTYFWPKVDFKEIVFDTGAIALTYMELESRSAYGVEEKAFLA
ncbi:hypothetical protein D3C71_2154850 [compost metagenome]